jgi:hypothetical protein
VKEQRIKSRFMGRNERYFSYNYTGASCGQNVLILSAKYFNKSSMSVKFLVYR